MDITAIIIAAKLLMFSMNPVEDSYIKEEYQEYAEEISAEYNMCPELVIAIIERESSGRANVSNESGTCHGLMQINLKWHGDRMERLGVTDLFDPYSNILVGVDFLAELFERYEDTPMVLMTYNGTKSAKERWESGEYTAYAIGVMERAEELERLEEIKQLLNTE